LPIPILRLEENLRQTFDVPIETGKKAELRARIAGPKGKLEMTS
jgi:hypothetical protein